MHPTKLRIKSEPYLHFKSADRALNLVRYVPNRIIIRKEGDVSA